MNPIVIYKCSDGFKGTSTMLAKHLHTNSSRVVSACEDHKEFKGQMIKRIGKYLFVYTYALVDKDGNKLDEKTCKRLAKDWNISLKKIKQCALTGQELKGGLKVVKSDKRKLVRYRDTVWR